MTDTATGAELLQFIERHEQLDAETRSIADERKELIAELKIDTKVWDVAEFKCSKQEVGSKYRDQDLKFTGGVMDGHAIRKNEWTIVTLWHVNAKFRRKAEEIAIREIGREVVFYISAKRKSVEALILLEHSKDTF